MDYQDNDGFADEICWPWQDQDMNRLADKNAVVPRRGLREPPKLRHWMMGLIFRYGYKMNFQFESKLLRPASSGTSEIKDQAEMGIIVTAELILNPPGASAQKN
jgi:hypothetical protein